MSSVFLTALLLGTALPVATDDDVQMQRSRAADQSDIVVTGQQEADRASSATKSATPIAETPQSISVVTGEDIAELGLQNLNQALRFVAGITPETRGSSAEVYDQFKLRGFDAPAFLDGLKMFQSPTGYAVPQVDVSRLDRVEILKGPASVLYGQSSPGGLVAQSSKLPIDTPLYGAIAGRYGTYDLYRVDADIGGRAGGDVLWRLYGSANGASTQQRFGKRERETVSAAVTAGAGRATSFTLLGAWSHDPYNGTYGVFPTLGTLIANPNGRLPTRFDAGEPGNRFRREQAALTYIFRHDFGDGWALRSSGRYQHVTARLGLVYTTGTPLDAGLRRFGRASYATDEQLDNWTYDNQLTGSVRTGPAVHTLLFGTDRQVAHAREAFAFGSATPIDVYAPVYGTMAVPQTPAAVPDPFAGNYAVRQRQQGVYAQDQIAVGALRVTLSGRHDWTHAEQAGLGAKDDRKFTWRAGALYTLPFGLAPYVSYATSFEPQTALVRRGDGSTGIADPSLGKQIEAGAKFTVPGTPILLTGAWFRIDQTNVLTSTPDFTVSRQTGQVRSTGVEFEGTAPLPHGFAVRAAYSRQSVRVTADAEDPSRVGRRLETVGRGGASLNLDWAPTTGPLAGLTLGGAVRHVDRIYAGISPIDGIARDTPAYTVFDALARYDLAQAAPSLKGMTLAVNATNLFDKRYLTSCFANYNWCWYGNRRTVQATIGYRF
ncbi:MULTISPECIES: TonB-dependent siderophore receptor [unclassified Sphingomonas]|jgi:iron complex outermembrane recepter protein|uniref:TonB-dependent siderophore receptor n=1 Tax=unclassified Sphingomonas TaxID=196159 RepID=UPI000E1051EB|nr:MULTISPECIES: TonB-dependent siderophore receptor [unclassified Sphingomonas]AXJ95922.1 TonB-dependent siderophore receptor [Sphingomonas sp. FARSPH]